MIRSFFYAGLACICLRSLRFPSLTMSSLEIAELTGKMHKNVMEDVRKMLISLKIESPRLSADYKDAKGRTYQ